MHTPGRINPFINREPLKRVDRAGFLARVRKGLGREGGQALPWNVEPPVRDESLIRQVAKNDPGRVDRWVTKAGANGMVVTRVGADAAAVIAAIEAAFAKHTVGKVILNAGEIGDRFGVSAFLAGKGIGEMRWGVPESMALAFGCDAAITDVRAGLADTGSLLVWSDAPPHAFGRSSTLVVPVHVALLPVSRILADLIDGFDLVMRESNAAGREGSAGRGGGGGGMPSNVVVINGPSKTSDIEMKLITGVHGPKCLYVIVIDGT